MRNSIEEIYRAEFEKLIEVEGVNKKFIFDNNEEVTKTFSYVFMINVFKNKAETRSYFNDEFNMTFSLLLEAIFALYTGQCRSALLLLRSAQEANFIYVLEQERKFINNEDPSITFRDLDFRFVETKRSFLNDIKFSVDEAKFKEYYQSIERNLTHYKTLSGVVHSQSIKVPLMNVEYFSKLYENTIIDTTSYFNLFNNVLEEIFLLNYFMLRKSLIHWDYYELYALLNIVFGRRRTDALIKIVK